MSIYILTFYNKLLNCKNVCNFFSEYNISAFKTLGYTISIFAEVTRWHEDESLYTKITRNCLINSEILDIRKIITILPENELYCIMITVTNLLKNELSCIKITMTSLPED